MKDFSEWMEVLIKELEAYGYFSAINPDDVRRSYDLGYSAEDVALVIWDDVRKNDSR